MSGEFDHNPHHPTSDAGHGRSRRLVVKHTNLISAAGNGDNLGFISTGLVERRKAYARSLRPNARASPIVSVLGTAISMPCTSDSA